MTTERLLPARWRWAALAAVVLLASAAAPARACSVCACGDPLAVAAEGQGGAGDLRLALDAEYLNQKAGSEGMPGMRDLLDQYTLRLTGVYSPVESLNLVASLPLTRKKMGMEGGGAQTAVSDQTGVGDLEVGGRWFFVDRVDFAARRRQGLALSLGTSLPTGSSDAADAAGERIDEHGQLGTGGWGPYAGLSYRLRQDPWGTLTAAVTGRLRTENAHGYRYGHALLWTVQGQWTPLSWIAVGAALEGRNAGRDKQDGAPVENTGGLVLAATPSVYVDVYRGLWLNVRAQLPFYTSLVGDQSVGPTITAGLAYQVF